MLNIIRFFKGYVKITVDGYFIERFINLCINKNIYLWDIKKMGENRLSAKVFSEDFKKLRIPAKKTKSKVTIVKKSGLKFYFFRYRKRKLALIGVAFIILSFTYFSGHIIGIDINGNESVSSEIIMESLKDFGISYFVPVKNIDKRLVQNKIMNRFDEFSWVGVNVRGPRVYIEIKERLKTKEGISKNTPCDLVANKSGIIEELDVREGQSLVKKKEFVEKGDLLVSGMIDSKVDGIRYVHSFGEIYAITREEEEKIYNLEYVERVLTGNSEVKYNVVILGKKIKLYFNGKPAFRIFEKKTDNLNFLKTKNFYVEKNTFNEQNLKKIKLTEKDAYERGKIELTEKIKSRISKDAEILSIDSEYEVINKNTISVKVVFELRENIAEERLIDKTENLNYTE